MFKEYFGGSLESILADTKDDEDVFTKQVESMINDISSSDLSSQDKMELLKEIKNYSKDSSSVVENYFAKDDSLLINTINEMSKNSGEFSVQDKLNFLKEYSALEGAVRFFDSNSLSEEFMKNVVDMFEAASDGELKELQQFINPSTLSNVINTNLNEEKNSEISEKMTGIVSKLSDLSVEEDKKSNKPAETLDEFMASITDIQTKKFYEQIFAKYDYDEFWDRTDVPMYFQTLYSNVSFSTGTIKSHGCGITSLAMISSYLKGEEITPDMLTNNYYGDNPASAMEAGFRNLGLDVETYNGDAAVENLDQALENGPIIARMGKNSLFTDGGHFIVIAGKTDDGKYIVNDPYIGNYYANDTMVDGFTNGFTQEQIAKGLSGIYKITI